MSVVLEDAFESLGEGPYWDANSQSIYCTNLFPPHYFMKYNTVTGKVEKKPIPGGKDHHFLSFIIPTTKEDFVISLDRHIQRFDWESGQITKVIAELEEGTSFNINDAKCDVTGRLWTGSLGHFDLNDVTLEGTTLGLGSIYSLERSGKVRKHMGNVTLSNGIAWTADNRTMFYNDSLPGTVYAYDFDKDGGNLSNQRVFMDFSKDESMGKPDGMCMDTEDKLWIACFGASSVIRVDSNTGAILQTVKFPVKQITSCCFGGVNMDELYVTCIGKKLLSAEEQLEQPQTGSLFKVTGLGVKGGPVYDYDPDN